MHSLVKCVILVFCQSFLFGPESKGGGVIQGTASEATLVALLSARARTLKAMGDGQEGLQGKLVAYASKQAHSSAERAAMLGGVKVRCV